MVGSNMLDGNTDEFLEAIDFYKKKEAAAMKKNKNRPPFRKPAAYLNTVVFDRLWELEKIQEEAKIVDINQAKKHRR